MLSSDIAGVPAAGIPKRVSPDDWSVTVPRITRLEPNVIAVAGASTVVADSPFPKQ